jgi:RNA polymerase sigma factor (sigma-70 family)
VASDPYPFGAPARFVGVQPAPDPAYSDGDQAFERLYRRYVRDVYRYTLAVLRNPADAEDVTQTTFLNAYRAIQRGQRPVKPQHWLIKIAHNVCRTRYLRIARRPQEVPLDESLTELPLAENEIPRVREVLDALAELPFNQRAALVMRELEGRTYVEIADALETTVPAVESLLFRARRSLKVRRRSLQTLSVVPLPGSLATTSGGGAVAGGGTLLGSGLITKAAAVVATGLLAGGLGYQVTEAVPGASEPSQARLVPLRDAALGAPAGAQQATRAGAAGTHEASTRTRAKARSLDPFGSGLAGTGQAGGSVSGAFPRTDTPKAPSGSAAPQVSGSAEAPAAPTGSPLPAPLPELPSVPLPEPTVSVPSVPTPTVEAPSLPSLPVTPPSLPPAPPLPPVPPLPKLP